MQTNELQILSYVEEPFSKKFKMAKNACESSEFILQHKEILLLQWIIKHANQNYKEGWNHLNYWLKSAHFKRLNRNDINREDFLNIIKLIDNELSLMEITDNSIMKNVLDSILLLIGSDIFQHYFKYNVDIYCKIISSVLHKIECLEYLQECLKMDLFHKNILAHKKFPKNFLITVLARLTECLNKFDCIEVFELVSKLIKKCLFYKNHKSFKTFIDNYFENVKTEKQRIPKALFKYILYAYNQEQDPAITFKIIFHAFCAAYNTDFELIYKFFILLVHIIGFDLKDKLILNQATKLDLPESKLSLIKSQKILLSLLDILCENKNDLNLKVNNITFTDFIRNIMKEFLYLNTPSVTCYKIFIKAIAIDPLLIEPITDSIIIYTMILDSHRHHQEQYEIFIIHVFDIYSKLRRVENFISRIVHSLNYYFNGHEIALEETYKFKGEIDTKELIEKENVSTEHIFTNNILQHFSKCICGLASWQIINIFKTLLYQLHQILNDIDKNDCAVDSMEIMSVLLCTFLASIRIGEHTVVSNVVEKSLKELEELRNILERFGIALLNREHNQKLMRSFLNIAYNWAEVRIILEYYSIKTEVQLTKLVDNNSTACNIIYLHSYLTVKQWCLISERITNFGEVACKQLLEKLYIQKLRAMLVFEKSINEDIIQNVIKNINTNLELIWRDILENKYVIHNLLPKMGLSSTIFLAEKLVANKDVLKIIHNNPHITNSSFFITGINYFIITKINKLLTKKDKINNNNCSKATSTKISEMFTKDTFLNKEPKEIVEDIMPLYYSCKKVFKVEWKINEEKIHLLFQISEKFPVIYCSEVVQKLCLIYLCSLHRDLSFEFKKGQYKNVQVDCERVIIGILQHCKFKLANLFRTEELCKEVVENYDEWEHIFSLITENVFKDEFSVEVYEPVISYFTKNLLMPICMRCCVVIINIANKIKKIKTTKNIKNTVERYKIMICDKILDVVMENEPSDILIDGYCWALRHFMLTKEDEKVAKLLIRLDSYVKLALKDTERPDSVLMLFITILENKVKMNSIVGDDFSLRIWDMCKERDWIYSATDKHAQLVKLIFGQATNEEFAAIIADLLKITEESAIKRNNMFSRKLKTWEWVMSCNINPLKIKVFQSALEKLLQTLTVFLLQGLVTCENFYENVFSLEKSIIHSTHIPITSPMLDTLTLSITLCNDYRKDKPIFNLSITLLESLLKYRKPLVMDRVPTFLQIYRILLKSICERSNTNLNLDVSTIKEVSDCSHQLEKITKNLALSQRDMGRIAMYLIADILQQYEQITLHPTIKIHLNNCIYILLTVCDQHAVAFLMRSLSSASTEIFKNMYENYKKFYRFTGKV